MKIQFYQTQDLIFADKPAGIPTHAPDHGKKGFAEILSDSFGQKVFVNHRLDKTTTGAMVFTTTTEAAERIRQQFEKRQVKKKYWLVTDRFLDQNEITIETFIEKQKSSVITSQMNHPAPNAKTVFRLIKRSPFYALWEALPETGKQHQIRLHAANLGMPILGDTQYGGSEFPHLCLHSYSLQVPGFAEFLSPAPRFFERLGSARDQELVRQLSSLDRRQRLYGFLKKPDEVIRLVHTENSSYRIDLLGPVLWCHWYKEKDPSEKDLERFEYLRSQLCKVMVIQKREDRGKNPNQQQTWLLGEVPDLWQAQENGLLCEFRKNQGLSAGLFLDQRQNREKIKNLSQNKTVLNLFAYTGFFSVYALSGNAKQVTTVDLSKNFLEWGKKNVTLNDQEHHLMLKTEWSAADTFVYLKGALKRNRKWDLIICDPPSFSRFEKTIFRLSDDLESLVDLCLKCLAPKGTLLMSCNHESLTQLELESRVQDVIQNKGTLICANQDYDFELPNEERSLKAVWVTLK